MRAPSYTIRMLTKEFGVTTRTIRFYEAEGLLQPQRQGTLRVYSARDRARLSLILRGKRVGFSLAQIREMIALFDLKDAPAPQLTRALELFEARIATLERQRADIDAALSDLAEGRAQIELSLARRGHTLQPSDDRVRLTGFSLPPGDAPRPFPISEEPV